MTRTLTRTSGGEDRPKASGPIIRLLYSHGRTVHDTAWALRPGETELGRQPSASQQIALLGDPHLSRRHVVLERRGARVVIRDLDSRNGTSVNGNQVDEVKLEDGDVIRLSDTVLMLRLGSLEGALEEASPLHGLSPAITELRRFVALVAPTDATVVLTGATGTGKGVSARAIHDLSSRASGPFIGMNCAAIPEGLAESALFGHKAGSFTGAKRDVEGYFRAAEGGTLFMDEIGDLPIDLQPKLLHAIEERSVVPVGSTTPIRCDIRIIAATTVDLESAVSSGAFRPDLYARLADMVFHLPPLKERREDVLFILEKLFQDSAPPLSPDLAEALVIHAWPFNVRGLKTVAKELMVRGEGSPCLELGMIQHRLSEPKADAAEPVAPKKSGPPARTSPPTRDELIAVLASNGGVVSEVARSMDRSRKQVYRWLEQHQLDPSDYRSG